MSTNTEIIKSELKPLYADLLKKNTFQNVCTFCMQWGSNFFEPKNQGILFVGKAVNGWVSDSTDIEHLFGDSSNRIFARNDQMQWVKDLEGVNDTYNTNKSAFWRVIKKISTKNHPDESWFSHVAWSNLYKIAPFNGGNPSDGMIKEQLGSCQLILQKEIEQLKPKCVVMFTSGMEKDFLKFLNGNKEPNSTETITWDGYETKLFVINDLKYIVTPHPQGKDESKNVEAVLKLIN